MCSAWDATFVLAQRPALPPQQPPRHQLFHDLGGAAVDAQHARVCPEAGDGVFGHVALAAKQLQEWVGHAALQQIKNVSCLRAC